MNEGRNSYILWLPSWYPNRLEPYNGDFIQRHARAASIYDRITVIFFTQYGMRVHAQAETQIVVNGKLKEIIVTVPFRPLGNHFIDRLRYNLRFYQYSRNYLKAFFKKEGLPELVHVHVPIKAGNLALWIKNKLGIPFIVSEHSSAYLAGAPDSFYKRHHFYQRQVKNIFCRASLVTNVSHAIGRILTRLFSVPVLVVPNTVDTDLFNYKRRPSDLFTYIHVSTLSQQKNIRGMLASFSRLAAVSKDWKLLIVGPYREEHIELVNKFGLSNLVTLTGEVPYPEVARFLQQSDVLVMFSLHENFPCSIIEALCCGLPVISSDVGGIGEAVNKENGVLVPSQGEQAFFQALQWLRAHYKQFQRETIAREAAAKYGFGVIGQKFHELYQQLRQAEKGRGRTDWASGPKDGSPLEIDQT